MANESSVKGFKDLRRYKRLRNVPRPSPGCAAMFIWVTREGPRIMCMLDDGRTVEVMDVENTAAQLS